MHTQPPLPRPTPQGQALAALAQLASLEVVSRAAGGFETWSKALRGGSQLACGPAAAPRRRHGTSVAVAEFACCQPVRRRALLAEAATGALAEAVKRRLTRLMLGWPEVELALLGPPPGGARVGPTASAHAPSLLLRLEQVRTWWRTRGCAWAHMGSSHAALCYSMQPHAAAAAWACMQLHAVAR